MEMSKQYMKKTAEHLKEKGYSLEEKVVPYGNDGAMGTQFVLQREPKQHFILETLEYSKAAPAYFLEIVQFFGLTSFSFPLDSWKYFQDRVEFKYYVLDNTGIGLSFTLRFSDIPTS